jgi:hypothetical protein
LVPWAGREPVGQAGCMVITLDCGKASRRGAGRSAATTLRRSAPATTRRRPRKDFSDAFEARELRLA